MSEVRRKTGTDHKFYVSQVKRKIVLGNGLAPINFITANAEWLEEDSCEERGAAGRSLRKAATEAVGTRRGRRRDKATTQKGGQPSFHETSLGDGYSAIFNDSYPFELSPFSKLAKSSRLAGAAPGRMSLGLKYVGLDDFHTQNSSGEVDQSQSTPYRRISSFDHEPTISESPSFGCIFLERGALSDGSDRDLIPDPMNNRWNKKSGEDLSFSTIQNSTQRSSPENREEVRRSSSDSSDGWSKTSSMSSSFLREWARTGPSYKEDIYTSTPAREKSLKSLWNQEGNRPVDSQSITTQSNEKLSSDFLTPISQLKVTGRERSNDENSQPVPIEAIFQLCEQIAAESFSNYLTERSPAFLKKAGEGVFSEVFLLSDKEGKSRIWKVQPFEGDLIFNGGFQKKSEDILSECVLTRSLSDLRKGESSMTECFVEVVSFRCVHGPFPEPLLQCWKEYDEEKGSENDSPELFPSTQLLLITEMEDAGVALEDFIFASAPQALSIFTQVAYALAVAERALEFEHRDLHWGNIMVSRTTAQDTIFSINGERAVLKTRGVAAKIVDYSLSRAKINGNVHYADLAEFPEIFEGTGEYQFEIYRLMKGHKSDEWENFTPYTNVLWLHYVILQMCNSVQYKNKRAKIHREYMKKMEAISTSILEFKSAEHYVSMQEYYL